MAGKKGANHANATSFGGKSGNPINTTVPGSGRPPNTFVRRMQILADRAAKAKRWEKLLADKNPDDALFFKAFGEVADRGYGRATQPIETNDVPVLTEAERLARIKALIALG